MGWRFSIVPFDFTSFLGSAVDMDGFIESVIASADAIKAERQSSKTIDIAFDEWNVWYNDRWENEEKITDVANWPIAPRLLEDVYTVADAVVVGNLLISLLNHSDRVKAASMAATRSTSRTPPGSVGAAERGRCRIGAGPWSSVVGGGRTGSVRVRRR